MLFLIQLCLDKWMGQHKLTHRVVQQWNNKPFRFSVFSNTDTNTQNTNNCIHFFSQTFLFWDLVA